MRCSLVVQTWYKPHTPCNAGCYVIAMACVKVQRSAFSTDSFHASRNMTYTSLTHRFTGFILACCLLLGSAAIQAQQLTPAQMAYLKAETRKADEAFVKDVAGIVGVRSAVIAKEMPEHGRIADPVARLVAGLERSLGKPLSDDQKTAIRAADTERLKAIERANKSAPTR
ncbi:MAG: hypothetical protein JWL63_210 [Rhodocyclales bacterium]|nr:hypothetical protein [Rhodocyclales bacterium]